MDLRQLVKMPVMISGTTMYTVKGLINYAATLSTGKYSAQIGGSRATAQGGHYATATPSDNLGACVHQLKAVARVVSRGVKPLRDAAEASLNGRPGHGAASQEPPRTTAEVLETPVAVVQRASYVLNASSRIFHNPTCSRLPATGRQDTGMNREEVVALGYRPCGLCKP